MFVSRFLIEFTNKVSRTGYEWKKNKIFPKQDGGYKNVDYSGETFSHFTKLKQYYNDTEMMKVEGLKFFNNWGRLAYDDTADELDLMVAVHQYESIRFDLSINKKPNLKGLFSHKPVLKENGKATFEFSRIRMSFEWDNEGKYILPAYHPSNLWEAIKLNLLLSGPEPKGKFIECLYYSYYGFRKGCNQFIEGRKGKKFCSSACRVGYYDKNKAQKRLEEDEI